MKVKMCGLRRMEDIQYANQVKPDYVGFVFAESSRKIDPALAQHFQKHLDQRIQSVGVFVNEDVQKTAWIAEMTGLDVIQLHGDEDKDYIVKLKKETKKEIWKAVRVRKREDIEAAERTLADKLLLDSFSSGIYGGTGKVMNLSIIKNLSIGKPYFIAGGLNSENLKNIIEETQPYGIDISGGLEINGYKDLEKMKKIMSICRRRS